MNNPKTTVPGFILLAASILYLVGHFLVNLFGDGGMPKAITQAVADWPAVAVALGSLGLIGAKDGGA